MIIQVNVSGIGRYKDTIPGTRRRSVSRPDRYLRVQCGPVVGTFVFFTEEMAKRLRPQSAVEFVVLNWRILFYYAILPFFLVILLRPRASGCRRRRDRSLPLADRPAVTLSPRRPLSAHRDAGRRAVHNIMFSGTGRPSPSFES